MMRWAGMKTSIRKPKLGARGTKSRSHDLAVRIVSERIEIKWFDERLAEEHYLGPTPSVGGCLRQAVEPNGEVVARLVWGAAALKLKDREAWIGWSTTQRGERLKLVVQNRRFLLLPSKGPETELGFPGSGGRLPGVARARAGTLWLPSAAGRDIHRSGELCGHLR